MMPAAQIDEPLVALVLLVALAFPLHEAGHLLALRLLGLGGGLKMGALGLAVRLPACIQGWRLAAVAACGGGGCRACCQPAGDVAGLALAVAFGANCGAG